MQPDEHHSFAFDGFGLQYLEIALSDCYIGSNLVLAAPDCEPVVSVLFLSERYGGEEDDAGENGDTTVFVEYNEPRDWKGKTGWTSEQPAPPPAPSPQQLGSSAEPPDTIPWMAHVTAFNRWHDCDYPGLYEVERYESTPVTLCLLVDFDAQLAVVGLGIYPIFF